MTPIRCSALFRCKRRKTCDLTWFFCVEDLPLKFYTLGYGGLKPTGLIEILKSAGVTAVADVRLWPHLAHMGSYQLARKPGKGIEALLQREGILYYSVPELGNVFLKYADWQARYRELLAVSGRLLFARLMAIPEPCCILCAEHDPALCHRSNIAEYLAGQGHEVEHLLSH